jgi:hypothetical protein
VRRREQGFAPVPGAPETVDILRFGLPEGVGLLDMILHPDLLEVPDQRRGAGFGISQVHMHRHQGIIDGHERPPVLEDLEQGKAVLAPRNRDGDPVPRGEHPVIGHGFSDEFRDVEFFALDLRHGKRYAVSAGPRP